MFIWPVSVLKKKKKSLDKYKRRVQFKSLSSYSFRSRTIISVTQKIKYQPTENKHISSKQPWDRTTTPWYKREKGNYIKMNMFLRVENLSEEQLIARKYFCIPIKTILTFWYTVYTQITPSQNCSKDWLISNIPQTLPMGLHCLIPFFITEVTQVTLVLWIYRVTWGFKLC